MTSTFMLAKLHTHYCCCWKKKSLEDDQSDQNERILLFLHNSTTEKTFCWNINSRLSLLRISDLYPFVQSEDFIHQLHFWLFFLGLENLLCLTSIHFYHHDEEKMVTYNYFSNSDGYSMFSFYNSHATLPHKESNKSAASIYPVFMCIEDVQSNEQSYVGVGPNLVFVSRLLRGPRWPQVWQADRQA